MRTTIRATIIGLTLLASASVLADAPQGSPQWIIEQYFAKPEFPDFEDYLADEEREYLLERPTIGAMMKSEYLDSITLDHHILESKEASEVWSVETCVAGDCFDTYFHFVKSGDSYKVRAIRALSLTGIYEAMLEMYTDSTNIPDSVQWQLDQARLVIGTDRQLRKHYSDNTEKFDQLAEMVSQVDLPSVQYVASEVSRTEEEFARRVAEYDTTGTIEIAPMSHYGTGDKDFDGRVVAMIDWLHLDRAQKSDNAVYLYLGGIMDNSVGYCYVPEGSSPPEMSPNDYIMVEEIAPHWYLFKTT